MSYASVPGYFDFEGFYSEVVAAAPSGSTLVEVGCWLGRSVIYLAEQVAASRKDIRVFAIDTWRGSAEHCPADQTLIQRSYGYVWHQFVNNVRACGVQSIITPMPLPSLDAAKYFDDASTFMVFIDAQHNYEPVKADIAAWRSKVKPGGYLAGHDYGWGGPGLVKRAVDEAFPSGVRLIGATWVVQV